MTAITLRDQLEQISLLEDSKRRLQDDIDTMTSKIGHFDAYYVHKDKLTVLESRCMELEQKLDYEKSMRVRYEVSW